ncbi:retrovirus-related Pol polyprotein from transposon TNT 1-94 [Trichonephila clavipes]|nr:retrovirus-related Pol polyprotein from transposon TNT 1-94 [Trichonephila clavipes]
MDKITIPDLNGTNYFIWELKMKAALSLKRLVPLILEEKPEDLTRKDEMDWITKNSDAIAYIKLSLADEQALQFAAEDNAKVLWDKIRATYMGEGEDRKIDAGNELKNIRMKNGETVADYIARARGISTKCHSLGLDVSPRELVYHTVRGLNGKFSKVRDILKTQRGKSMDEILQILREEEATLNLPIKTRMDGINEAFYCKRKNEKQTRLCYICRKSNHLAKDCYYRNKNTHSPSTSQRNNSSRNGHVFTASHREEKPCDNIWILDSGASCHMAKEPVWFKNISPEVMDIYLADKNSKIMSQGIGNVSAKTVSTKHCNSINLTITDVSYVPQLRCNLLSVTCLMDKGSKYENLTHKRIKKIRTDNGLEFVNEQLDTYLANSGIFHEKTIPYNSESNGKAERANRVLLERARSLLYESKLPLKFWAEAINCSTQVSNVTPRKGKEKIPLEIWTGNKPKLNYLKKFGCVAYFQVPKVLRNKFEVPGRRGIMLGYARERRGYRIYDIKNQKVIEERSVKFNEYLKGSNYLGEIENETWDIDSFFEVTPERNEINQNTENGVLYNFDINNGPGAIENDNSIPLQTTSSSRTGRIEIPVLELNDVQNQILVRRSERLKSELMSVHLVNNVPNSYFEAENSANWKNWKLAMENELDSLDKHKVWEIVQKPAKSKLIKTKWLYSLKQDDAGKNIKYKARLVAAGFNQIKNIDYSESYSPVVNIESFRLLIALAAKLKLNVNFFDVKTAYLYGDLEETVYVLPPPGYEKLIGDDKVCKLNKSIYGLPQSGRNCKIKNVFEVVENKTNKFLGMEIEKCENGIYLSQCDYINSLLVKHNLENCKSVKTPIVKGEDKIFPSTNEFIDITMYQELIGELLYLANRTRPDISFVISYLSQFNHNPEKRHYNLAKRVLRYLMGSKDKKLFYENGFGILNASSDASGGNAENGESFSGGVVLLGNSLILWKCRKQKSVSLSTCEAELFSISEICKDIIWTVNLLTELKCEQFLNNAVTLNSDSQAAIQWIKGTRSSNKSRHMNLRFHFIKDLIEDTVIKLEYVQTEFLIADFLTKAMNVEKLEHSMQKIALLS